jgi:hypothetical protein
LAYRLGETPAGIVGLALLALPPVGPPVHFSPCAAWRVLEQQPGQRALSQPQQEQPEQPEQQHRLRQSHLAVLVQLLPAPLRSVRHAGARLRRLGCGAYLRYVADFALFSDSRRQLWAWKAAIIDRLASLRLVIHETRAQVLPAGAGIPWLGFVVYPNHRLVKARKVRNAHRRLRLRVAAFVADLLTADEQPANTTGATDSDRAERREPPHRVETDQPTLAGARSQGKSIQTSCATSWTKLSTNGRPAGLT